MSDQDVFQSGQKQCGLQIVSTNPYSAMTLPIRKTIKQNNHNWKFEKIKRVHIPSFSPTKIETKNISFQTEQLIEMSQNQQDSEEETRFSMFSKKYAKLQQVYQKKSVIGTRWLGKKQYFSSIFVDPNKFANIDILEIFKPTPPPISEDKIYFDSNFQSANLQSAYKINKYQYDLILQNDINTKGNTQWFYFVIHNLPAKTKVKINIVNMLKSDSLFNYGMQPCLLSEKGHIAHQQGWIRSGTHIKYFRNENKVDGSNRFYYTLTFTISTPYEGDTVKVAQCYPYTVSDLKNFLQKIEKRPGLKNIMRRESAGTTLGKNQIEVIHIQQDNPRKKNTRNLIFVTARQHPGETPGSLVCQGFINFILSEEKQAIYLRKNYEIVIFPMINPDGVTVGNYRTNLFGLDLNRRWDSSKSKQTQQIIFIKKYMNEIARCREISMILDLHGHSRKLFSFFYGNTGIPDPISVRLFPYICAKNSDNRIRFEDCTFICEEQKRRTARIQLGMKFKSSNIFTFQSSFYGYINKRRQKIHFSQEHYHYLGKILGISLFMSERAKTNPESIEGIAVRKYYEQLINKPDLVARGNKACSGSQSQPEKGQIKQIQFQKLSNNEQTTKETEVKQRKSLIKNSRKDILIKQISKASRQLHVMDIARVNSVFPNDILALVPSNYGKKKKDKLPEKKSVQDAQIQTDDVPFIKIYDICKIQQLHEDKKISKPTFSKKMSESSSPGKSNLFRTVIRPKSSNNAYIFQTNNSVQRKQPKKRQQSGITIQYSNQKRKINSFCQTIMTFPPNADFLGKALDCMIINPIPKTELVSRKSAHHSTINSMSSSEVQPNKRSTQSFKIGLRALNVETWRIKKKNIQ